MSHTRYFPHFRQQKSFNVAFGLMVSCLSGLSTQPSCFQLFSPSPVKEILVYQCLLENDHLLLYTFRCLYQALPDALQALISHPSSPLSALSAPLHYLSYFRFFFSLYVEPFVGQVNLLWKRHCHFKLFLLFSLLCKVHIKWSTLAVCSAFKS